MRNDKLSTRLLITDDYFASTDLLGLIGLHCIVLASSPGHALPDFISQPWRKIFLLTAARSVSKIWEWPGDVMRLALCKF